MPLVLAQITDTSTTFYIPQRQPHKPQVKTVNTQQVEPSTNCLSSCWLFRLAFSFLQVSTKLWALLRMWVHRSNFWHRSENVIYSTWEPTNQRARFDPHENQPIRECDLFSLRIDQSQHQSVEIELFMMQNFTYFSRGLLYAALHLAPHQPLRFSFQLPGWEKKI